MKRFMVLGMVASPLIVGLLATVALAEKGHSGGPPPCTDPIPAERQAKLIERFGDKGIDANKDGTVTCDEVKAFFEVHPDLRMHGHGGRPPCVDPIPADKQAELLKKFGDKGIDADKDGKLTCDEVKAFFGKNPPPWKQHHEWLSKCTDPIPADKQTELLKKFGDKGIDADKDGKLTCDEVKAFFEKNPPSCNHRHEWLSKCTDPIPADKQAELLKKFGDKGIDADKDGKLTCDEVKAFFEKKHAGEKGACSGKHTHAGDKGAEGTGTATQPSPPAK